MEYSEDLASYLEECLEMDRDSASPYLDFVCNSREDGVAMLGFLFAQGASEISPPFGRVALHRGRAVGLVAGIEAEALSLLRVRNALLLRRGSLPGFDDASRKRSRLAARTLFPVEPGDFYAARCAVASDLKNSGVGVYLMRWCIREARAAGCRRVVGDVEESRSDMLRLCCEGLGFEEVGREHAEDPLTGRTLDFVHIAAQVAKCRD